MSLWGWLAKTRGDRLFQKVLIIFNISFQIHCVIGFNATTFCGSTIEKNVKEGIFVFSQGSLSVARWFTFWVWQ